MSISSEKISFRWFRDHLVNDLLPKWYKASVTESGLFHANLSRNWSRTSESIGTLVSQCRLIYVFSIGYEITGENSYKEALKWGADFLLDYFYDKKNGGFFWSCKQNGSVVDDSKNSYGHTFVILGLSYANKVTKEEKYLNGALKAYQIIENKFQDKFGGLIWWMTNDWKDNDGHRAQNPLMHYFEALLTLSGILSSKVMPQKLIDFVKVKELQNRMIQIVEFLFGDNKESPFVLQEFYTKDWQPYYLDQSGPISIGHHFEWAFLLSSGVEKGLPFSFLKIAQNLLETALDYGFDKKTGVVYSYMDDSKKLTDPNLYWWDFSEALRTLLHFILLRNRSDLIPYFDKILDFVKKYFIDPDYSGWYTKLDSIYKANDTNKGSLGKLDYHQTALCLEAIRLETIMQNLKKE